MNSSHLKLNLINYYENLISQIDQNIHKKFSTSDNAAPQSNDDIIGLDCLLEMVDKVKEIMERSVNDLNQFLESDNFINSNFSSFEQVYEHTVSCSCYFIKIYKNYQKHQKSNTCRLVICDWFLNETDKSFLR